MDTVEILKVQEPELLFKQEVEALRQETARLQFILDNAASLLAEHTPDGTYSYVSGGCRTLLGYEPEELLGRSIFDFFHPDDLNTIHKSYPTLSEMPDDFSMTYRIRRKDGHYTWFKTTNHLIRDGNGHLEQIISTSRDITARKQNEELLGDSQHFIQRVTEAIPGILYVYDLIQKQMIYKNSGITRTLGYNPQEIEEIGPLHNLLHPDDVAFYEEAEQRLIHAKDGAPMELEYRLKHKNGEWHWFINRTVIFSRTEEGLPYQTLSIIQDITQRKRALEILELHNRRLSLLGQAGQSLTETVDLDQICQRLLSAAQEITGAHSGSVWLVDPKSADLTCQVMAGDKIRPSARADKRLLAQVKQDAQVKIKQDSMTNHITVIVVPLRVRENVIGLLQIDHPDAAFTRDDVVLVEMLATSAAIAIENARLVESLRQTASELQSRNQSLDAFARSVAHDLKAPLAMISGYADLLKGDPAQLTTQEVQSFAGEISQGAELMSSIVNELLLLARTRTMDVHATPIDMRSIVQAALYRLDYLIEQYHAEIVLPGQWPIALGYAPWIGEVWANYLSNALKYGGEPPHIELGATALDNGHICFWIKDNGKGLTPQEQTRLFMPFTRLDEDRASGHGLGLTIVESIIQKLGGRVAVESELGKGTTFSFTLPAA